MTRVLAIVVLAVAIAVALWLALSNEGAAPPPATAPRGAAEDARPKPEPVEQRTAVRPPVATPPAVPPGATEPPAAAPTDAAAPATVQLHVRDLAARTEVATFRWTFRPQGGEPVRGRGAHGEADLPLAAPATGELVVEAEGFTPATQVLQVLPPAATPQQVEVALLAAAPLTEVTLQATAPDGAPVERLRLDVWKLPPGAAPPMPGADPATATLWSRVGTGVAGAFRVPDLEPGSYSLRAQPVDAQGAPLPMLPWRHVFAFGGDAMVPLTHRFAAGLVLQVDAPADGRAPRECTVVVRDAAGEPVATSWRSSGEGGAAVVGTRTIVLPGTATTVLALPPAAYTLEVSLDGAALAVVEQTGAAGRRNFAVALP